MRRVQLAVVLLLVCVSCAEALTCNHCVPVRTGGSCSNKESECVHRDPVCISVVTHEPRFHHFKRCSKRSDAKILESISSFHVTICETDLCN